MQQKAISYRDATPEDAESIAALGRVVFTAFFGYSVSETNLEHYLDSAYTTSHIRSDLLDPSNVWIVAVNDSDAVLGFAQLKKGTIEPCIQHLEKPVELHRLYVDTNYHGSGIGRSLTARLDERAREMSYANIWLGVWEDNLKAQAVYRKLGYQKAGEHDFTLGTCVQTDWILSKPL